MTLSFQRGQRPPSDTVLIRRRIPHTLARMDPITISSKDLLQFLQGAKIHPVDTTIDHCTYQKCWSVHYIPRFVNRVARLSVVCDSRRFLTLDLLTLRHLSVCRPPTFFFFHLPDLLAVPLVCKPIESLPATFRLALFVTPLLCQSFLTCVLNHECNSIASCSPRHSFTRRIVSCHTCQVPLEGPVNTVF